MTLCPPFRDEWILHHAAGLLVVNKPPHVPCQAPANAADDLPARAKAHLGLDYLGIHQRLDAATSGVIAYATVRDRNAGFVGEAAPPEKTYVACVKGFRGKGGRLESYLAPRPGGGSVVSTKSDPRAKRAVTDVEVLRREGERTMLRLRIRTGRTHQIRVQLASTGSPIVGDGLYGDVAGPGRLLLHAHTLRTGSQTFEAPVPQAFDDYISGQHDVDIAQRIRTAAQRRYFLFVDESTDAFRLFHGASDGVPGVSLDVYGRHLLLHLHDDEAHEQEAAIADALRIFEGEFAGLYVKRRPRQANEHSGDKRELAPPEPLWGTPAGAFEMMENGLRFGVNLGDGLSTGIFLDQRRARARIRDATNGARVLNLFAYTCPFGVAAAAGGADEVVNVDSSGAALGRGKENFERNGLSGRVLKNDAFEFLQRSQRKAEAFDWVICDPPTYATGKKRRWKSGGQWKELAALCAAVTSPNGQMLLCSNDSRMPQDRFRRYVREGVESTGRSLRSMRDGKGSRDFPAPPGAQPLPRRLWLQID